MQNANLAIFQIFVFVWLYVVWLYGGYVVHFEGAAEVQTRLNNENEIVLRLLPPLAAFVVGDIGIQMLEKLAMVKEEK